jgi:hypothetical protein
MPRTGDHQSRFAPCARISQQGFIKSPDSSSPIKVCAGQPLPRSQMVTTPFTISVFSSDAGGELMDKAGHLMLNTTAAVEAPLVLSSDAE